MSYRFLARVYDRVAPSISRYRSPEVLTSMVRGVAPDPCELLDVGVGTGLSIAPYVGAPRFTRIVGVDPSARMLDRCRSKFPRVELHHGTLDGVRPCLSGRFDIVQSCGAVEHMPDLVGFVRTAAALVKPDGYLVVTYEPEVRFRARQAKNAPHVGTFGLEPVYRRTPHEVSAALADGGFSVCEDVEFTAYLGLVHHCVVARRARASTA